MPGEARFLPHGDSVVEVRRSQKLKEPEEFDFITWGDIDWAAYLEAKREYQEELKIFQDWTWVFRPNGCVDRQQGFASSKEEAIEIVENIARTKGYILYNG